MSGGTSRPPQCLFDTLKFASFGIDYRTIWRAGTNTTISWTSIPGAQAISNLTYSLNLTTSNAGYGPGPSRIIFKNVSARTGNSPITNVSNSEAQCGPIMSYVWKIPNDIPASETLYRLHLFADPSSPSSSVSNGFQIVPLSATADSGEILVKSVRGANLTNRSKIGISIFGTVILASIFILLFLVSKSMFGGRRRTRRKYHPVNHGPGIVQEDVSRKTETPVWQAKNAPLYRKLFNRQMRVDNRSPDHTPTAH